jgi:membrane-associated protein
LLAILHDLPTHLALWSQDFGPWLYALLFAIIFCETGLVVLPFLPGDSLLFAVGALAALPGGLDVWVVTVSLIIAAIAGNWLNYLIGAWVERRLANRPTQVMRFLKPEYLARTREFYARYGARAIIITRFIPIVRTYAPFVAGLGAMQYKRFIVYNAVGGALWIGSFIFAGYFFGNIELVRKNFQLVILAILAVSVLPVVVELWRGRRRTQKGT